MKVAYLLGSLNRGGAEVLALDVLRESKNSEIEFICIHRKNGSLFSSFKALKINTFQCQFKNKLDISYFFKLRRLLKQQKVEIVHAHQVLDALMAHIATLFTTIKVLQTFHGHGFNAKPFMLAMRGFILKINAANIFVSHSQYKSYLSRFDIKDKRNLVLYNTIDFSKFNQLTNSNFRKELGIDRNVLLSGSVGNFTNGRDQLVICKFLSLLHKKGIHFYHIFAGAKSNAEPGLYKQCVDFCQKNNLSKNVLFLGSRNDVPEILGQLDAFVYSTVHDTFGIAVIEAIASETPVFVNDWEVMKEITENGKYANIYQSKNEYDLMHHFTKFLSSRKVFKLKAKNASKYVHNKFTIENHILELTKIYSKL
jgi:glycosyltransferase involved in cell wall biosynthesis